MVAVVKFPEPSLTRATIWLVLGVVSSRSSGAAPPVRSTSSIRAAMPGRDTCAVDAHAGPGSKHSQTRGLLASLTSTTMSRFPSPLSWPKNTVEAWEPTAVRVSLKLPVPSLVSREMEPLNSLSSSSRFTTTMSRKVSPS